MTRCFIMKMSVLFALVFIVTGCANTKQQKPSAAEILPSLDVTSSVNRFNDDVFAQVCKDEKSVFYSSPSVYNLLFALMKGAGGNTYKELENVLYVSDGDYSESLSSLVSSIENMTNSVWLQKKLSLNDAYKAEIEKYGFDLFQKDFYGEPEKTRNDINQFIEKNTKNVIKDFLKDDLDRNTKLVLLSTLYFNQKWQSQFNKENTYKDTFYVTDSRRKEIDFMHQTKWFDYAEYSGFKALKLPYESRYALYVFLPDEINADFSNVKVSALLGSFEIEAETFAENNDYPNVALSFPKFENEADYDFAEILERMGVHSIFNPMSSDLSKILSTRQDLYVNLIKHKAKISVSEEKTVAAAVTIAGIKATSARPVRNVRFTADHPFIYVIKDEQTGLILFTGIFRG